MKRGQMAFHFFSGDCNWQEYGGTFISKRINDGDHPLYFAIQVANIENNTEDSPRYFVSLVAVSPAFCKVAGTLDEAMKSNGFLGDAQFDPNNELLQLEALLSYGNYATLGEWQGQNIKKLLKTARDEAQTQRMFFGFTLDRVANGVGNTGWDFIAGKIGYGQHYVDEEVTA
jgi:hypothetical protein